MSIKLFEPIEIRGVQLSNRVVVAPMTQFSSTDGIAGDWHFVHLGQFAASCAGLVLTESTYVSPNGRNTLNCLGLYTDEQEQALGKIATYFKTAGKTQFGVQLCHAGRKASARNPWDGGGPLPKTEGGFDRVAPSPIQLDKSWPEPEELSSNGIIEIIEQFASSARRAVKAGASLIELHGAHGYLIHQFLSPLTNQRHDSYGGEIHNRIRLACEIFEAVRDAVDPSVPIGIRISATDWIKGGWDPEQSIVLLRKLQQMGLDYVHVSSGGLSPEQKIEVSPGYQVPFAERIKSETDLIVVAVGQITTPEQAESILRDNKADLIALARAMLFNPHWTMAAAHELGAQLNYPRPYVRGHPDNWSRAGINAPGNKGN